MLLPNGSWAPVAETLKPFTVTSRVPSSSFPEVALDLNFACSVR